jgi:hypothetical protein
MIFEIEQSDWPLTDWPDFFVSRDDCSSIFRHLESVNFVVLTFIAELNLRRWNSSWAEHATVWPLKVLCNVWSLRTTSYLSLLLPISMLADMYDALHQYCTEYYPWHLCLIYTTFQEFFLLLNYNDGLIFSGIKLAVLGLKIWFETWPLLPRNKK